MRLRLTRQSSVSLVANYWWSAILAALAILMVSFLLVYKLGTLTPGFSNQEITQRSTAAQIVKQRDPLFPLQNGLQYGLQHVKHYGPVAMRAPGVLLAGFVVLCLYHLLTRWYTKRMALIGVLTLATSSWFLHTARLATPDVMYLTLFALFAVGIWLQHSPVNRLAVVSCFVIAGLVLYIPGMIWFVVPLIVWQRRRIRNTVATFAAWQLTILLVAGLLVILPLVLADIRNPGLITTWLGFPGRWPNMKELAKNAASIPTQLFWRGPADWQHWLGRLPLLDWFQATMFVIGLYAYRFKVRLDRTWLLIYVFVVGAILIALHGPVSIALLLPFVYLIILSGIALMMQQWFTVFPRNPFARGFGVVILSIALLISCAYQLDQYFVAWPRTPQTKAVFQNKP